MLGLRFNGNYSPPDGQIPYIKSSGGGGVRCAGEEGADWVGDEEGGGEWGMRK